MEKIITWDEVVLIHGTVAAISADGPHIRSILIGSSDHSDEIKDNLIFYKIPKRKHYKNNFIKLANMIDTNRKLEVFQKIRKNMWTNLGLYQVKSFSEDDSMHIIILSKI